MSDNVLGTNLAFWQFLSALVITFLGIIGIKLTFDINKHLKYRQERFRAQAINACVHFEFIKQSDTEMVANSFFISPPGTIQWRCQRCGLVRDHVDFDAMGRRYDYYLEHIDEYSKQNSKFLKILKKSGNL